MLRLLLLLTMLGGGLALAAPVRRHDGESVPLPLGIADAGGKAGFLANAKGGIDAVNLATGELLWESTAAGKPLAVEGGKVAALQPVAGKANVVEIVFLDATDGKQVLVSDPVVFPEWVSVELTHGRTFTSSARVQKGVLLLSWEAHAFYAGGAAPTPEVIRRAKKEASGVARIDCATGKVAMDRAAVEQPELPEALQKVKSQQYWTGRDWKTDPILAGETVCALEVENLGKGESVMRLKRWELATGKEKETVELLHGKAIWPQLSGDGRFLFVHQALVKEQLPAGNYAWWIFDLQSGKQVAKIPFEPGMADLAFVADKVFFVRAGSPKGPPGLATEMPRVVRALDAKTGKQLWERAVEPQRRLLPLP
jgi:outer membrane protein assembly factor BamB